MGCKPLSIRVLLASVAGVVGSTAYAANMAPVPVNVHMITSLAGSPLETISTGTTIERYLADLVQPIRIYTSGGDGLSKADIVIQRQKELASARADALSSVLRYDLDGDGVVTTDEIRRGQGPQFDRYSGSVTALIDQYDANGDGKITLAEIIAVAEDEARTFQATRLERLLTLDPDHDGTLTVAELLSIGRATFSQVDTDGDGVISAAEFQASAALRAKALEDDRKWQAENFGPRCPMPPAGARDNIIAVGVYEAQAMSPLAIGGQDKETNLGLVHIEKGSTPLYVVLSSYDGMLWRFDGDVSRVSRVVVSAATKAGGRYPAAGVAGIRPGRVTFLRGDCLPSFYDQKSNGSLLASGVIRRSLGRASDRILSKYSAKSITLPSGTFEDADRKATVSAPPNFDPSAWRDALGYWPAGIGEADRKTVVSAVSVEPYDVFPSQIGIAQLLGNGSIVRGLRGQLRIVRPVPRFPAQMYGGHSARLFIAPGVPLPPGNPGHSCVTFEDGSVPRSGAIC